MSKLDPLPLPAHFPEILKSPPVTGARMLWAEAYEKLTRDELVEYQRISSHNARLSIENFHRARVGYAAMIAWSKSEMPWQMLSEDDQWHWLDLAYLVSNLAYEEGITGMYLMVGHEKYGQPNMVFVLAVAGTTWEHSHAC